MIFLLKYYSQVQEKWPNSAYPNGPLFTPYDELKSPSDYRLGDISDVANFDNFRMISFAAFHGIFVDFRSVISGDFEAQRLKRH